MREKQRIGVGAGVDFGHRRNFARLRWAPPGTTGARPMPASTHVSGLAVSVPAVVRAASGRSTRLLGRILAKIDWRPLNGRERGYHA